MKMREQIKKCAVPMQMQTVCAVVVACVIVLGFVGCSRVSPDDNHEGYYSADPFYGETLIVSTVTSHADVGGPASIETLAVLYMLENQGVTIEIVNPFANHRGSWLDLMQLYREYTTLQLMTGTAPTLFEASAFDWYDSRVNRFFADWYPIIQQDPYFIESDFYVNAFSAISSNAQGRLVVYPYSFSSWLVATNISMPGIMDAVISYNSLSISEMHRLHHLFAMNTPVALYSVHSTLDAVIFSLGEFVDFENRTADINNQVFIQFITLSRYLSELADGSGRVWTTPEEEAALSASNLFNFVNTLAFQYLLEVDGVLFGNPLPKANDDGELLIFPDFTFALCASSTPTQKALAWDFIMYMQQNSSPLIPNSRPVYRPLARETVRHWMPRFNQWSQANGLGGYEGGFEAGSDTVFSILDGFHNRPMALLHVIGSLGNPLDSIIIEVISDFDNHLITAEQAAEYLQNRISLYFLEMN